MDNNFEVVYGKLNYINNNTDFNEFTSRELRLLQDITEDILNSIEICYMNKWKKGNNVR
jgi:hypothetical protein